MVVNGVTDGKNDVVPVGIDFRTGDVSGNLIITKNNNNDVVQGVINNNFVFPGFNSITFQVTPNCKYTNFGFKLKQVRNNETSNDLFINPIVVSTIQPNHNFKTIDNVFKKATKII